MNMGSGDKIVGRRNVVRIVSAPRIGQMYWCDFGEDVVLPEMPKNRPVVVLSHKNNLYGTCLVVPTSTDPQDGRSAEWAHRLSFCPDGRRETWVVCNHLYTVSTARLAPLQGAVVPKLERAELNAILGKVQKLMPPHEL